MAIDPMASPAIASPHSGAEHAGQHLVVDDALKEREAGDVLDAVGDADQRDEREGEHRGGSAGEQCDRDAPEHERERKRLGEPLPRDAHREEGADEAARADGRVEEADPARALVEDVERDDDDQHVQRAADERLGDHQGDHDARPGLGREDAEAREHAPARIAVGLREPASFHGHRGDENRGGGVEHARTREHPPGVGGGDDDAAQRPARRTSRGSRGWTTWRSRRRARPAWTPVTGAAPAGRAG